MGSSNYREVRGWVLGFCRRLGACCCAVDVEDALDSIQAGEEATQLVYTSSVEGQRYHGSPITRLRGYHPGYVYLFA